MYFTSKEKALIIQALSNHAWAISGNEKNLPIEELIEKLGGRE